jgi:hypothetical protein
VSFEELAKLLATTQPPEDVIRVLNLTNKKLLRMVQQADFSSTLASVQQPIRVAINRLLADKPKSALVLREAAISQQLMVEELRGWSLNRFSFKNQAHVAKQKHLCALYNAPGSVSNTPSPYLKIGREWGKGEELALFKSQTPWVSASELSLRLLDHLAQFYPDLYRTLVLDTSTLQQFAVSLPVLVNMVGNSVLDVFSAPPSSSTEKSDRTSLAGTSSSSLTANGTAGATSSNASNLITSSGPSSSLHSAHHSPSTSHHSNSASHHSNSASHHPASSSATNSTNSSPSGSLLVYSSLSASNPNLGSHSPHRSLWERDATKPFESRLPEVVPLFFDSPLAFEEVFAIAMYIIYYLACDNKVQVTMLRMPQLLARVQSRLKKLFAKGAKVSDFKTYAMKAVKPVSADQYEDSGEQKNALVQKILSQSSEDDAHDAINTLISIMNDEEKMVVAMLANPTTTTHATTTSGSSPTSSSLLAPTKTVTSGLERKSPDQSPARAKIARKQTESPSKRRKRSSSADRNLMGWSWLKPHISPLMASLASSRKYETISFASPHIVESRLFVNSMLKLMSLYVKKVPGGISDVDSIVRSLDRQNPSSPAPYSNFIEYLKLNNSIAASYALDIVTAALKAESKPVLMGKLLDCDIATSVVPHLEHMTTGMLKSAEMLQSAIVDRILEIFNFQMDSSKPEHFRLFTSFWNACFGENGKQLSSSISKQWLLLGFPHEDPTKLLKTKLPIHFLCYANEHAPERIDAILSERLLLRSDDYCFAEMIVKLSDLVVTTTQAAIGIAKMIPIVFSDNNFFEELCTECIFIFDAIWRQQTLQKSQENVDKVLHHIKKVLFAFLPQERSLPDLAQRLNASILIFGSNDDESLQFPETLHLTYLQSVEGKYKEFLIEQEEIARMDAQRREHAAKTNNRRKSMTRQDHSTLNTSRGSRRKSMQRKSRPAVVSSTGHSTPPFNDTMSES